MIASSLYASNDIWEKEFAIAKSRAKNENKCIIIDFTGSDWCMWCKKLDSEVFSKEEFKKFAKEEIICYKADFPKRTKIDPGLEKINKGLAQQFQVQGLPTVIILDPDCKKIGKTGYKKGGVAKYIKHLKEWTAKYKKTTKKQIEKPVFRIWTNKQGQTMKAVLLKYEGKRILLEGKSGTKKYFNVAEFSQEDLEYLKQYIPDDVIRKPVFTKGGKPALPHNFITNPKKTRPAKPSKHK